MKENWTPKKLYNLLKETVIGQDKYRKIFSTYDVVTLSSE